MGKYIETPRGRIIQTSRVKAQLIWNPEFQFKWNGRYNAAQMYVDSEVLRLSDPYVPFQSGMLKLSGQLGTVIGSGLVVYNAPYAKYQYYGYVMAGRAPKQLTDIPITYNGAPKRGKLWFERMKVDHKESIIAGARKRVGGSSQ
ncbi:MAG: minor capsid protein [Anaerotignum propionicum]|uniref:minor capsid protein n=1 Tax=Anaerotignum propionicum TaxID=28446 RepID=UPI002B216DBC|nr:minor capsid protein [Anaerotignum propionicum]MEA5057253.1 minor capsid protein [Anaerotignum propionicum]